MPPVAPPPNVPPLAVVTPLPDPDAVAPPAGPDLGPPTDPSLESPAAIAARRRAAVSRALDDPNAPGRNNQGTDGASETLQPKLAAEDQLVGSTPAR